jgi:hypothetical protein
MQSKLNLICASVLVMSANAQSNKYIVANAFASAGCGGQSTETTHINTGQCYYAKEECGKNPDLAPECDFLKQSTLGEDISFKATCNGGKISAIAYTGKGCDNQAKALNNGSPLPIPDDTCLANFKLQCSDDPNAKAISGSVGLTSITGMISGLLALIFV